MADQNPKKRPADDESSAPESGTVRDETSGNQPSDRNNDPRTPPGPNQRPKDGVRNDDTTEAGEER